MVWRIADDNMSLHEFEQINGLKQVKEEKKGIRKTKE